MPPAVMTMQYFDKMFELAPSALVPDGHSQQKANKNKRKTKN
jgi:hypothetical protein